MISLGSNFALAARRKPPTYFQLPRAEELKDFYQLEYFDLRNQSAVKCEDLIYIPAEDIAAKVQSLHRMADRLLTITSSEARSLVSEFRQLSREILAPEIPRSPKSRYTRALPHFVELYVISQKLKAASLRFGETNLHLDRLRYEFTTRVERISNDPKAPIPKTMEGLRHWIIAKTLLLSEVIVLNSRFGANDRYRRAGKFMDDLDLLQKLIRAHGPSIPYELQGLYESTQAEAEENFFKIWSGHNPSPLSEDDEE